MIPDKIVENIEDPLKINPDTNIVSAHDPNLNEAIDDMGNLINDLTLLSTVLEDVVVFFNKYGTKMTKYAASAMDSGYPADAFQEIAASMDTNRKGRIEELELVHEMMGRYKGAYKNLLKAQADRSMNQ